MLEHLRDRGRSGELGRELRRFAVACCGSIPAQFLDPRSRAAVEIADRMTRGEVPADTWEAAHGAAGDAFQAAITPACRDAHAPRTAACAASRAALLSLVPDPLQAAAGAAYQAANAIRRAAGAADFDGWVSAFRNARASQAAVLRDIVGEAFRPGGAR